MSNNNNNNNNNLKCPIQNGGRSGSQISIYDYPEHLNPFYEDENHKRIRFWQIGKSNKNGHGRRGSFSLGGLKEMWAFKSFRLKKKPSSLGINKTSESPPPIRRDLNNGENHYGTYDPRMRHTMGNTLNNNFLRNVSYRASLQDMRSVKENEKNENGLGFGFARNDRYRSTIQTTQNRMMSSEQTPKAPPRRYVYGGSVTPQPRLRSNNYEEDLSGISRGSSQLSVASKNPFEDDDDDDVVIGRISSLVSEEGKRKRIRKKRRAPPPPVPIPKAIDEEVSVIVVENHKELTRDDAKIADLAVEIQNFVKSVDSTTEDDRVSNENDKPNSNDDVTNDQIGNCNEKKSKISVEVNIVTDVSSDTTIMKQNQFLSKSCHQEENIPVVEQTESEYKLEENAILPRELKVDSEQNINNKKLKITEEELSQPSSPVKNEITKLNIEISDSKDNLPQELIREISPEVATDVESNITDSIQPIELKITESLENLSESLETSNEIVTEVPYTPPKNEFDSREIKKTNFEFVQKPPMEEHHNTGNSERRCSVREIIESINRSQKLLKINQTPAPIALNGNGMHDGANDLSYKENIKAPPRRKHDLKNKQILTYEKELEIEEETGAKNSSTTQAANKESNEKTDNNFDKTSNTEKENEVIFKKCEIKKHFNRESSPISSNLDWNPLPKPKRTKKLVVEVQENI